MQTVPDQERQVAPAPHPLWRNRDYMLLWSGQTVSVLGSGISGIAYPLLVLALTRSPAQAGIVGALFLMPYVVLSLPAGALVDRWNRKRVMIVCDTLRAFNIATIPAAALLGHLVVYQLYGTALVEGTCFVFFNVAEVAALPRVVPQEQLPSASAQNEAASIAANLVSSPVGGFIFQTLGQTIPFLFDAISYTASVLSLTLIGTKFQGERAAERQSLWTEVKEGLGWLWNQPLIRFIAFLTGGWNFSSNATALILIVLARHQGAPPSVIGIMFSVGALGGLLGALLAPRIQRRFGFPQVILGTLWVSALVFPLFAVAPNPLLLGAVMAVVWMMGPIYNAVQLSYRLAIIPDALQGRVNSAVRLIAWGTQPLGMVLSGVLIQSIGAVGAVLFFAATMLVIAVLASLNPHVRRASSQTHVTGAS